MSVFGGQVWTVTLERGATTRPFVMGIDEAMREELWLGNSCDEYEHEGVLYGSE